MANRMPAPFPSRSICVSLGGMSDQALSVLLLGATGTAGRGAALGLIEAAHQVTALIRRGADTGGISGKMALREGDATDPAALAETMAQGRFDVLVICLASRTGLPRDAWAIDHDATVAAIDAAKVAGIGHVVLLSAICVQSPRLAFQHAKLAAEAHLRASGLVWTIVRPTAFFKSLSGQIARVQAGKPYLMFGDGALTRCAPISDRDLGRFIAACLTDPAKANAILPVGGPGEALTPRAMGEELFRLTGRAPKYRRVPVAMMRLIIGGLSLAGRFSGRIADKAEFAQIGHYYATESMLAIDPASGGYSRDATPVFGEDRLFEHYARVIEGNETVELGDHAMF